MSLLFNSWTIGNNALRGLNCSLRQLYDAAFKLSSGLKINRAADDPAGLVISEQMRSRIASLNKEIEGVNHQINKYETASSSLMQMRGLLTEMRSLAVAAANSAVNDPAIMQAYQTEANRLVDTYNDIAQSSQFGTQHLLDGSEGSLANVPELAHVDLSDVAAAEEAIGYIDEESSRLDGTISHLGATQKNDLESRLISLRIESENLQAAKSQIRDTDYALEFSNFIKAGILARSSLAILAHSFIVSRTTMGLLLNDEK